MYLLIVSKQQSNSNNEEWKIGTACEKNESWTSLQYNLPFPCDKCDSYKNIGANRYASICYKHTVKLLDCQFSPKSDIFAETKPAILHHKSVLKIKNTIYCIVWTHTCVKIEFWHLPQNFTLYNTWKEFLHCGSFERVSQTNIYNDCLQLSKRLVMLTTLQ